MAFTTPTKKPRLYLPEIPQSNSSSCNAKPAEKSQPSSPTFPSTVRLSPADEEYMKRQDTPDPRRSKNARAVEIMNNRPSASAVVTGHTLPLSKRSQRVVRQNSSVDTDDRVESLPLSKRAQSIARKASSPLPEHVESVQQCSPLSTVAKNSESNLQTREEYSPIKHDIGIPWALSNNDKRTLDHPTAEIERNCEEAFLLNPSCSHQTKNTSKKPASRSGGSGFFKRSSTLTEHRWRHMNRYAPCASRHAFPRDTCGENNVQKRARVKRLAFGTGPNNFQPTALQCTPQTIGNAPVRLAQARIELYKRAPKLWDLHHWLLLEEKNIHGPGYLKAEITIGDVQRFKHDPREIEEKWQDIDLTMIGVEEDSQRPESDHVDPPASDNANTKPMVDGDGEEDQDNDDGEEDFLSEEKTKLLLQWKRKRDPTSDTEDGPKAKRLREDRGEERTTIPESAVPRGLKRKREESQDTSSEQRAAKRLQVSRILRKAVGALRHAGTSIQRSFSVRS